MRHSPSRFSSSVVIASRVLIVSALALAGFAHANTVADNTKATALAKEHGCLSCHAMKEKVVGPSYLSVAEKYKGDKDAVASLVQSIHRGSSGKWGRTPMPSHDTMTQEDMKTLATWVMSAQP